MRTSLALSLMIFTLAAGLCRGEVGGNVGYAQSGAKARAEQKERAKRTLTDYERPPTSTSSFVEADVLMNVKADEFVAVFGISQEGETVDECGRKMTAAVKQFTDALKPLKIGDDELFLDFITQTKIYGYQLAGDVAQEKLVGFELKKNLSIHYKDRMLLDKLVAAAAQAKVYDLVKVDYVVRDAKAVQEKLMERAATIVKAKTARYEKLLGVKLNPPAQIYAVKSAVHYPSELYDSYTAAESEQIGAPFNRQRYTIQTARKGRTFFFNGLDGDGFDEVINPVIIEPVVQFTLHLKIKYEVEQPKAK